MKKIPRRDMTGWRFGRLTVIETALLMKLYATGCVMVGNVDVIADRKYGRAEMTRCAMVY